MYCDMTRKQLEFIKCHCVTEVTEMYGKLFSKKEHPTLHVWRADDSSLVPKILRCLPKEHIKYVIADLVRYDNVSCIGSCELFEPSDAILKIIICHQLNAELLEALKTYCTVKEISLPVRNRYAESLPCRADVLLLTDNFCGLTDVSTRYYDII